jgi:NAD+ diphosphatase
VTGVLTEVTLPYNGLDLDRAGARRTGQAWVEQARAHPEARVVVMWRDGCLMAGPEPLTVHPKDVHGELVLLGLDGDAPVFATDLSGADEEDALSAVGGTSVDDVRRLFPVLTQTQAATLAYARGMLFWNRNQRFCGACGSRTELRHGGHLRVCAGCGRWLFPRIEPAVIMLVEAPGTPRRVLLARHRGAGIDSYSTLAGFVEIGESLEDAVRREVAEEAGVRVASVSYQASQTWPFPSGLMIGFRAVAESDTIAVDQNELEEARWFTREELAELLATGNNRTDSIEHHLIHTWMDDTA